MSTGTVLRALGVAVLLYIASRIWYKGWKWAEKEVTRLFNKDREDHAYDQAKKRGIRKDMIKNAIRNGRKTKGNKKNTTKYITRGKRGIWVVVDSKSKTLISTGWNRSR